MGKVEEKSIISPNLCRSPKQSSDHFIGQDLTRDGKSDFRSMRMAASLQGFSAPDNCAAELVHSHRCIIQLHTFDRCDTVPFSASVYVPR